MNKLNRYNTLKNKLSKTLKSLKYTIINNNLSDEERSVYIDKILSGVLHLFESDTIAFIDSLKQSRSVDVYITNMRMGSIDISLLDLCFKDVDIDTLYPSNIKDEIRDHLYTFVKDIIDYPKIPNTGTYVTELLNIYLALTRLQDNKTPDGKLTIYLNDK